MCQRLSIPRRSPPRPLVALSASDDSFALLRGRTARISSLINRIIAFSLGELFKTLEVADNEFRQFGYHVGVQKIVVHPAS